MIKTLLTIFFAQCFFSFGQEFESDLYASLKSSSLHIFMASEKSKMTISTQRNSKKNGVVEETKTTYRKGRINPLKINFNIQYSEFYVVEDRKKSLGKYEFNEANEIMRYERTDFDNRNQRIVTFYHYYYYNQDILEHEDIRIKEYVGQGSVEMDTVVYLDSVIYAVKSITNGLDQENLSDPGVHTEYELNAGNVSKKTNFFFGFNEEVKYTYDSKKHLVKIENTLTNEEKDANGNQKSIKTRTELHYSIDGLLTEAVFYDENSEMLERKIFTYK